MADTEHLPALAQPQTAWAHAQAGDVRVCTSTRRVFWTNAHARAARQTPRRVHTAHTRRPRTCTVVQNSAACRVQTRTLAAGSAWAHAAGRTINAAAR